MLTSKTPSPVAPLPASLDHASLDERAMQALRELLEEGRSANTAASYASAARYWVAWFGLRYGRELSLPVAPATVIQFILDHAARATEDGKRLFELPAACDQALVAAGQKRKRGPLRLSTILHRVSVLAKAHAKRGVPNPCADPAVVEVMRSVRVAHAKRGELPRGKHALTREPLERLLGTCDESLLGKRDRALLMFAFSTGGRRRSEVVSASMENVRANGDGTYSFSMGASKTNPTGAASPDGCKPVAGRAAQALTDWLQASAIASGPIFRRVIRGSKLGDGLSARAVGNIVQRRAALAGLGEHYSAHSLRSGYITEAGRQNVPIGEVMAMAGHRSVATTMRYFRSGQSTRSKAARLLDDDETNERSA